MLRNLGRRINTFFNRMGSYAKEHPWKAAAVVTAGVVGLLLIAGGIALTATAPATFGGGAAVGMPLLGAGTGLTAGFVLMAAGVVTTGCASGYLWTAVNKEGRRREAGKRINNALIQNGFVSHGEEIEPKTKPTSTAKKRVEFAAGKRRCLTIFKTQIVKPVVDDSKKNDINAQDLYKPH